MKNFVLRYQSMAKKFFMPTILIFTLCIIFTGCDRTPPTLSGVENLIEIDCNSEFNLKDYLNENIKISDETEDGNVIYKLSELEYTIQVNEDIYDEQTGKLETDSFGEYDTTLTVKDLSNNKANLAFTIKINPLKITNNISDTVEINCGTKFNIKEHVSNLIEITTYSGDTKYKIDDFDYTIDCDESIYNPQSSEVNTGKYGEYNINISINSNCFENNEIKFNLKLNPLTIQKDYYIYEDNMLSSSGYSYLGFCEYTNTSQEDIKIQSIELQYFDKDGVMISSTTVPRYSREYLSSGEFGFVLDTYSSFNSSINSSDEIADMKINIDFIKPTEPDNTSLQVGDIEIINNYRYNVSGFAANTTLTNPYDKNIKYYSLLAGMYDKDGNLIGVMEASLGINGINANSKAKATAAWLPNSRFIPDQVDSVKASAMIRSFDEN